MQDQDLRGVPLAKLEVVSQTIMRICVDFEKWLMASGSKRSRQRKDGFQRWRWFMSIYPNAYELCIVPPQLRDLCASYYYITNIFINYSKGLGELHMPSTWTVVQLFENFRDSYFQINLKGLGALPIFALQLFCYSQYAFPLSYLQLFLFSLDVIVINRIVFFGFLSNV